MAPGGTDNKMALGLGITGKIGVTILLMPRGPEHSCILIASFLVRLTQGMQRPLSIWLSQEVRTLPLLLALLDTGGIWATVWKDFSEF